MPEPEGTDVVDRLRELVDVAPASHDFSLLLARARARRRRRSLTGVAATAAVVAAAAGAVAVARPGSVTQTTPGPAAPPVQSPSAIDPWTDPLRTDPEIGQDRTGGVADYRGGVRLALLRDSRGTYAITAGMHKGQICERTGRAVPAGSRPVLSSASCTDDGKRPLWVPHMGSVAGLEVANVLVTPDATRLIWRQGRREAEVELHDLPGSGRKVALVVAPRLAKAELVAFAGTRILATTKFGMPAPEKPAPKPTTVEAVALFTYGEGRTMWAKRQDGGVHLFSTAPGQSRAEDIFGGVPRGPDAPVREIPMDRVFFGERWICGEARAEVETVTYRLADGRSVAAKLYEVPKRGRVWCLMLPHERLNEPAAAGDRIVAVLRNGTRYETRAKY